METAFENYKLPTKKKSAHYYWQEQALDVIEYLDKPKKSQIFKWAKVKPQKLEAVIRYMKEKNIKSFNYLAACLTRN